MNRLSKIIVMASAVFLMTGLTCTGVYAEEAKADKTGTNPVNFQGKFDSITSFRG